MNPKEHLDNNELEKHNHAEGKELLDIKNTKAELEALKGNMEKDLSKINAVEEKLLQLTKKIEENKIINEAQIEEVNNMNQILTTIIQNSKKKAGPYKPIDLTHEYEAIKLANIGRTTAAENIKDNIKKYPGRLGSLITSIDKLS